MLRFKLPSKLKNKVANPMNKILNKTLGKVIKVETEFQNNNQFMRTSYNLTEDVKKSGILFGNGKYFIINDTFFFSPYKKEDDINVLNTNIASKKITDFLDKKEFKEYYKYFVNIDNLDFYKDKKTFNVYGLMSKLNFTRARGNIFEFSEGNKKYKMFAYQIPIDKLVLVKTYLDLPFVSLLELNIYSPQVFLLETLLYFYEKNKGVFLGEKIKLVNYVKSIGINLTNIVSNLEHDEYFLNKIKRMSHEDLFYKLHLLVSKEIGVVGNMWLDVYVFAEEMGDKLQIMKPSLIGNDILLEPIPDKTMVYIEYLNRYNERLPQTSFNHSLWFNKKGLQEDVHFYDFGKLDNLFNFLGLSS